MQESDVSNKVLIRASQHGITLFRNNVGAGKLSNGRFMRWGLANESAKQNAILKSGDLIGFRPVLITQEMVGKTVGQFVSVEVKHSDWQRSLNDAHESAQQAWIDLVNMNGGYAIFSTGELS